MFTRRKNYYEWNFSDMFGHELMDLKVKRKHPKEYSNRKKKNGHQTVESYEMTSNS